MLVPLFTLIIEDTNPIIVPEQHRRILILPFTIIANRFPVPVTYVTSFESHLQEYINKQFIFQRGGRNRSQIDALSLPDCSLHSSHTDISYSADLADKNNPISAIHSFSGGMGTRGCFRQNRQ